MNPSNPKNKRPDVPVQTKIMFYTEGNPCGLLTENKAGKRTERLMAFENAHAALTWCQSHGSNLFYTATNLTNL